MEKKKISFMTHPEPRPLHISLVCDEFGGNHDVFDWLILTAITADRYRIG